MLSKTLIKKLQEADPEGNLHVCVSNTAIIGIELTAGYYDGDYTYVEESDYFPEKMTVSDKGDKIVIHTLEMNDFVWSIDGDLSKIVLDTRHKDELLKELEKEKEKYEKFHSELMNKMTVEVFEKLKDGYEIVQPKDQKIGIYNVMYWKKREKLEHCMQGECEVVLKSGFFSHEIKDDYIYWEPFWKNKNIADALGANRTIPVNNSKSSTPLGWFNLAKKYMEFLWIKKN